MNANLTTLLKTFLEVFEMGGYKVEAKIRFHQKILVITIGELGNDDIAKVMKAILKIKGVEGG